MRKIIYVLHERSTKEHFIALENYAAFNNLEIKYREFLILRQFVKSVLRLDATIFMQQIRNILFFISIFFKKNNTIIIGIAPLDFYLPFLLFFLKKHNLFYFTSWGNWSGGFFPKKKFSDSKFIKKSWNNFLKHTVKGVFAVTNTAAKSLQENFKLTCPISVVYHSVDNTIPINEATIKKRNASKINIVYLGRLIENKGIKELLSLMKYLDNAKFSLKIIGDGPLRNDVEKASKKFSNIEFFGHISSKKEIFDIFCKSDVQLLFSKKDTKWEELFGMVIIEAMYCGVPTISTNHVGPKSIIEHNINGFLIDEKNIIEETIKILAEERFKSEDFIENVQTKAQQFYKSNLLKKWGKILDNYI